MSEAALSESEHKRHGFRAWLKHAFSMEPYYEPLTPEELALLDRIARFIVRRHMTAPALLFLEMASPLNYVGSQAMAFFEPVVRSLFSATEYMELRRILERRQSVEVLMQRIEATQAEAESPSEPPEQG